MALNEVVCPEDETTSFTGNYRCTLTKTHPKHGNTKAEHKLNNHPPAFVGSAVLHTGHGSDLSKVDADTHASGWEGHLCTDDNLSS